MAADLLATDEDLASLAQQDLDTASAILALEICTAVVQAEAEQRIVRVVDDTVTVWGTTDRVLCLPEHPVVSVLSVTYNGTVLAAGAWRRCASGLWRESGWSERTGEPGEVAVVYTHGLAVDDQKCQYGRGVVLGLARGLVTNPDGVQREQIDDYAVAYAEAEAALTAAPEVGDRLRKLYGPPRSIRFIF
ncbi:hypothetical protein [Actinoplanes sp. NPDC051851]|uniref:hypothetical protein n=1 Tax=Actinoplanes sp. NPDC051851 TaxID=3154753 RepID=UPI00341DB18F